jgi:hypothetical protein
LEAFEFEVLVKKWHSLLIFSNYLYAFFAYASFFYAIQTIFLLASTFASTTSIFIFVDKEGLYAKIYMHPSTSAIKTGIFVPPAYGILLLANSM